MTPIRLAPPPPPFGRAARARPPAVRCGVAACARAPNERKPFCAEHLDRLPYPAALAAEVARRHAEEARVARHGAAAVDPRGPRALELVELLRHEGPLTTGTTARLVGLPSPVAAAYLAALVAAGRARPVAVRRRDGAAFFAAN